MDSGDIAGPSIDNCRWVDSAPPIDSCQYLCQAGPVPTSTAPARAIAAALARRPGWDRWIGPDDGVVVAQALSLAALAWPGRPLWRLGAPTAVVAGVAMATGGVLAVAAGAAHGTRLTPRVEPPDDATLLTTGPYAVSRHPIYGSLLVATAGWALLRRRPEPLLAWTALLAALTTKTRHEEARLAARYGPAYEDYRARTPRFLGPPRARAPRTTDAP